jgi:hypothetical protein
MIARALRAIAVAALVILAPAAALAQSAILQAGTWTPNHLLQYSASGQSQTVVKDAGQASGGGIGYNPSELGLTALSPTNTYPAANNGHGPYGTNFCLFDGPITNATGYHYLCLGPNSTAGGQTGGLIAFGAGGIAATLPFTFLVNGVPYTPGGVSNSIVLGSTALSGGAALSILNQTAGGAVGEIAGVTCAPGTPSSSFATTNGVVTHC